MSAVLGAIARAEREVASFAAVGLASADAAQVSALAQSLREAGLEGPAREAEKLAALVGPAGARDEQLNAFARLHQMLAMFRVRVAGVEDFSGAELVEVPPLPSLRVERQMLGDESGPLEYRPDAGAAGRYAYLVRAYRWLSDRPAAAPEGEGLAVWGDLSIGHVLGLQFEQRPDEALAAATKALSMWNVAVRRNAVQVLDKAFALKAPLEPGHAALELLRGAWADARPLVMHEAIAAWRRLSGLPPFDLSAPYEAVPSTGSAHAAVDPASLSIARRAAISFARISNDPSSRRYWKLPAYEWTPHEWSSYWQGQFLQSRQVWGRSGKVMAGASIGPRGDALEGMKRCFEGGKPGDQEDWIDFLWYMEDPLAARSLRPLLYAEKDSVRRRAIAAAGILGDPAVLAPAEAAILEKSKDAPWAVWGLAFLGDIRAFHILWKAFEAGLQEDSVLFVLPMFGEIAAPVLDKVAADPKTATPAQLRTLLLRLYAGRELDALLYAADRAADPKVEGQLLRPFAITKKRLEEWAGHEQSLANMGYSRNNAGLFVRDPRHAAPADSGLQAMQRGLPSHIWMEAENRRRQEGVALTDESDLDDWTEALQQRLRAQLHEGSRPDGERATALRRLDLVAGELSEARRAWAVEGLPAEDVARLEALAFPKKKGKGGAPK